MPPTSRTVPQPRLAAFLGAALLCLASRLNAQTTTQTIPQTNLQDAFPGDPHSPVLAELSAAAALLLPALENSTLPEAPEPQAAAPDNTPDHTHPAQTRRILGIMPNFRSVSADQQLPPQTVKDKFVIAARDSFDYSSFVIAAIQTSISFASDSYPEFHYGVVGYGRYYWHTLADTADENFLVGGALPAVFHQDSRFYTLGHGSVGHRALYAASRIVVSRKDDGDRTLNFAEVVGAGAAAGISSTYYPSAYRDWTKVGQKWLTGMIIDSANFTFKEFWPDINNKVFHTH